MEWLTRLLVLGVAALAVVAAVDAVRGNGDDSAELPARLEEEGVSGLLVYTEKRCRFRAIRLPSLRAAPLPRGREGVGCEFELSADGSRVARAGTAWSPDGRFLASPQGGGSVVEDFVGSLRPAFDGVPLTWRTQNTLTVFADGALTQWFVDAKRGDGRILLDQADLRPAAGRRFVGAIAVAEARWLDRASRVALLLEVHSSEREPYRVVAVFEGRRLVGAWQPSGQPRPGQRAERLGRSVTGAYLSVGPRFVLRPDGTQVQLPRALDTVHRIVWSPDGRLLALAARGAVFLVRSADLDRFDRTGREPELIELPIAASDLAWR